MCYKICSFFGQEMMQQLPGNLQKKVQDFLVDLIVNQHFENFFFGEFGRFELFCWDILTELKKTLFPRIKRVYIYEDPSFVGNRLLQPKWLNFYDFDEYIYIKTECQDEFRRCFFRDCGIICHSNLIVFYVDPAKNDPAQLLLEFAKEKQAKFVNLA